jgi:hypothetical protein
MSPLFTYLNKLLVVDGKLAANENCCCDKCKLCQNISKSIGTDFLVDCFAAGILKHQVKIPNKYKLPVTLNITGGVDDDLLIDGESITIDLGLDPGPYPSFDPNCVGAHDIGGQPGPFSDPINGGITFPINKREFEISVRDTIGVNAGLDITICINPFDELCEDPKPFIFEL